MARSAHHHVYVVEPSKNVLLEPKFRRCNPGHICGQPRVCVGIDLRSAGFGVWQA